MNFFSQLKSVQTKPYLASEFFEGFITFFALPGLLADWVQKRYNLNYHKFPEDLILKLLIETLAFGIEFYKLTEIEVLSSSGNENNSFSLLVDVIFEKMFSTDEVYLEKYREAKRKYSEIKREEIFNIFGTEIKNIINTFTSDFDSAPIESSLEQEYWNRQLQYRLKKFSFLIGEAAVGIFDWVSKLEDKKANRIFNEIIAIRTRGEINKNEKKIRFLEDYGFGTWYWRKCGIISMFDSLETVGKENTLKFLRLLFKRLW